MAPVKRFRAVLYIGGLPFVKDAVEWTGEMPQSSGIYALPLWLNCYPSVSCFNVIPPDDTCSDPTCFFESDSPELLDLMIEVGLLSGGWRETGQFS